MAKYNTRYHCQGCGDTLFVDSDEPIIHSEEDYGGCGPMVRVEEKTDAKPAADR